MAKTKYTKAQQYLQLKKEAEELANQYTNELNKDEKQKIQDQLKKLSAKMSKIHTMYLGVERAVIKTPLKGEKVKTNYTSDFTMSILSDLHLDPSECWFEVIDKNGNISTAKYFDFTKQTKKSGDMIFRTPTLDRQVAGWENEKEGTSHVYEVKRYAEPKRSKFGDVIKYSNPTGQRIRLLWPHHTYEAFNDETKIDTLFLVEGWKKAHAGDHHGIQIAGQIGLTGFQSKGELDEDLIKFINRKQVQKCVLIFDSDLFDISESYTNEDHKKSAERRPMNFCSAAIKHKTMIAPHCDTYIAYPTPDPTKKLGLDDLLNEVSVSDRDTVIQDLIDTVKTLKPGKWWNAHKTSALSDWKIKDIFHLTSVHKFAAYHKDFLSQFEHFKFYKDRYDLKDGEVEISNQQQDDFTGLKVIGNCIYKDSEKGRKRISNFTLKVLYLIENNNVNESKRIVKIANNIGQVRILAISMAEFNSVTDFRKLVESKGRFLFKGNVGDLQDIKSMVFQNESKAIELQTYGHQNKHNFFASANGIYTYDGKFHPCDEYGIVEFEEETYYIPPFSLIEEHNDEFEEDRLFIHKAGKATFKEWFNLYKTVYSEHYVFGFSFYLMTLFSDIIFQNIHGVPMLFLYGRPQSGKSTFAQSICKMFGEEQRFLDLGQSNTEKGMTRKFALYSNSPVVLDEFSQELDRKIQGFIKGLFNRNGYNRARTSNDYRSKSTPINGVPILAGQTMPSNNLALFTRMLLVSFYDIKMRNEKELKQLENLENEGLGQITAELLSHRDTIQSNFKDAYDEILKELHEKLGGAISNRMLKTYAATITPLFILIEKRKLPFHLEKKEIFQTVRTHIVKQNGLINENSETNKFFRILAILRQKGELTEGRNFKFTKDKKGVYLHIPTIQTLYEEYCAKNRTADSLGGSLGDYLQTHPAFVEIKKGVRFGGPPTTAFLFIYQTEQDDKAGIGVSLDPGESQAEEMPDANKMEQNQEDESLIEKKIKELTQPKQPTGDAEYWDKH